MVAGEGVETVLSVQRVLPAVPHVAALSGAHLAALVLPRGLRHFYIARDDDPVGRQGAATLRQRAKAAGILVSDLDPREDNFNTDLCHLGPRDLALHLAPQLDPNDAVATSSSRRRWPPDQPPAWLRIAPQAGPGRERAGVHGLLRGRLMPGRGTFGATANVRRFSAAAYGGFASRSKIDGRRAVLR
ncbi:toprim domain-containing protein [Methylobacterium indicum]|uniref:toprim domain-containing protein n=1 Tax=Methylobacterium indicum TaxID=1775910 RepID=UPI003CC7A979